MSRYIYRLREKDLHFNPHGIMGLCHEKGDHSVTGGHNLKLLVIQLNFYIIKYRSCSLYPENLRASSLMESILPNG